MKTRLLNLPIVTEKGDLRMLQILSLFVIAAAILMPMDGTGFSICVFYNLTGIPCPGCGLTRSVTHSLHGGLHAAFLYNPFGPLIALLVVFFALSAFLRPLTNFFKRFEKPIIRSMLIMGACLVIFGIVRAVLLTQNPAALEGFSHSFQDPRLHDFFINLFR